MTANAAEQLRRVLHLVPRIAGGEEHSLHELAEREGVSLRTLQGDLQAIALRFDDPGGFVEGVRIFIEDGNVSLFTDHFLRPMRLTAAELLALELGLAVLRAERPAGEHECIDAARERLRETLAHLPRNGDLSAIHGPEAAGLHADPAGSGDVEHLACVRRARSALHKLQLRYRKGDADIATDRTVHPYALVAVRGAWYLIGHCERAGALRIFRMDRVESVEETADSFAIPSDFSLDRVLRDGEAFLARESGTLRLRYSPRIARWIEERHAGIKHDDGSYVVEHPMADHDWAVRHVMQYGADVEVLHPASVRAEVVERLRGLTGD